MKQTQKTISERVIHEIKQMSSARVLFFTVLLVGVGLQIAWDQKLKISHQRVQGLRAKVPGEDLLLSGREEVDLLTKSLEGLRGQLENKQNELTVFADEKGVSLKSDVYAKAVGKLNLLIGSYGLKLVGYEEITAQGNAKTPSAKDGIADMVGVFSQRYVVQGDFSRMYQLLLELNQFSYLCRVTDISVRTNEYGARQAASTYQTVTLEFLITFYYLR